jgi:hypothetical protein
MESPLFMPMQETINDFLILIPDLQVGAIDSHLTISHLTISALSA